MTLLEKLKAIIAEHEQDKPILVSWSCPLLKGSKTNFGELLIRGRNYWCVESNFDFPLDKNLRLLSPATPKSNWQVYYQGITDLQTLHDAGFVVQICFPLSGILNYHVWEKKFVCDKFPIVHYRVIGIRKGFTDKPEEAA